jgi:hypothetical protein
MIVIFLFKQKTNDHDRTFFSESKKNLSDRKIAIRQNMFMMVKLRSEAAFLF